MGRRNHDPWKAALLGLDGLRRPYLVPLALALLGLLLVAPALFARVYAVKLKDGSLVFARVPYTVKGTRAIITLENGVVTQIPLNKVDEPGTEKYNRENYGNVIAITTPQKKALQLPGRATRSVSVPSDSGQSAVPVLRGGPAVRSFQQIARRDGPRSGSPSSP
ncbi:MAG TPA: hypothetical protein VGK86_00340 [Thermoanaerobaculia bacterium]|jgi:hypothetical protein